MAKKNINIGSSENAGNGDPLRVAFGKINDNFTELYNLTGGTVAELTELAQDYAAPLFNHSNHVNITAVYQDTNNKIILTSSTDRLSSSGDEVVLVGGADPYVTFPAITGGDQLQIQGAELSSLSGSLAVTSQNNLYIIANGSGNVGGGSKSWTYGADGDLYLPQDGTITGSNDVYVKSLVDGNSSGLFLNGNTLVGTAMLYANGNAIIRADNNGTAKDWAFGKNATLTTPLLLPKTFTAVLDNAHRTVGNAISGTPWQYTVAFVVGPGGAVETQIDNPDWPTNPGYSPGDEFEFTEEDHGIPGFIFAVTINGFSEIPGTGFLVVIGVTPPPEYPSTVSSLGAIKLSANTSDWVFDPNGSLTLPGSLKVSSAPEGSIIGEGGVSINAKNGYQFSAAYQRAVILNPTPGYNANVAGLYLDGNGATIEINTDNQGNSWHFNTSGDLTLPVGGDILDSTGQSVLGGGTWDGTTISDDLIPDADVTYDLGSPSFRFRDIYLSTNTIYLGSNGLGVDANGQLVISESVLGGEGIGDIASVQWTTASELEIRTTDTSPFIAKFDSLKKGDTFELLTGGNGAFPANTVVTLTGPATKTPDPSGDYYDFIIPVGTAANTNVYVYNFNLTKSPLTDITQLTGSISSLVNGAHTVSLGSDGNLTLPVGFVTSNEVTGINLRSGYDVSIISNHMDVDREWIFGSDGTLTLPAGGDILDSTGQSVLGGSTGNFTFNADTIANNNDASIEVGSGSLGNIEVQTVDEWGPPEGPGGIWRLFIGDEAYPTLGTTVQIGDTVTTSWGTPITATITAIQQDNGFWQIHVDQDITAGHDDYDTVTFSTVVTTKTWTFGTNGVLTAPGTAIFNGTQGIVVDNLNAGIAGLFNDGDVYITGGQSLRFTGIDTIDGISESVLRFWNAEGRHSSGNDPTELVTLDVGNDATNGAPTEGFLKIITEKEVGGQKEWKFDANGVLHLPTSGDIVDSEGNSVLGGGGVNNNIWVQTFVSSAPTTDFPQIATSVEYDSYGNVIALFSHFQTGGMGGDSRYFSVGKYTDTGSKIWTARFTDDLETDGWGLAVDNADGWIYVAGQTGGDVYTYDVSTLTKIDSGNGSVAWSKIYDFGFASSSAVVDVDSDGNPVMVGWANNENDSYLTVTKIDKTNGNVTWTRKLDGQTNEQAYGMAVGPTGEIVAVGTVDNLNYPEPYRTIVTLTATPASDPDWTTDILGATVGGLTYDVTFAGGVPTFSNIVDTDGNRYEGDLIGAFNASQLGSGSTNMEVRVGTTTGEDMSDRMVVVKYASDGTIAWQKAIQFDEDYDCLGADADIDSNGNIYICGQFNIDGGGGPTNTGMALVKFDSSGVKQWSRRVTGDCISTATSIVVGPDDKLYISGVNGDEIAETFTWVVAKYSLDGLVEWQRFIENTDSWTFAGGLFGPESGGSNIAVRQGYVALAGGFGAFDQQAYAAVLQIPDTGNVFAAGPWSVTTANLSGTLNGTASDIGVVNADLTDSDNALTVSPDSVTLGTDVGAFLIGTVYTAPGGDTSLVNGLYSVTLENNGAVTLPAGGTITEGYVTSNPTIQLTPASPDVASQKLVIKGGGAPNYTYTDNGININYYDNTALVGDTLTFYIYSPAYADQTLYWWIYPEGANISDPGSGTVTLTGDFGTISFELDSDDNEFTIRVSPEENNYDPTSLGVESGLINADAPTFNSEHHLHLTTGNLSETSIFLGTDDHNVRTTVNGGIEINTYLYPSGGGSGKWTFSENGDTVFPNGLTMMGGAPSLLVDTGNNFGIGTSRLQSQSAVCSIAVGDEFVADTEFNDDITVVQVGWTVVVDGTTYTVTSIDPSPPAWQYRITAAGATFVQGTTYTFTNPTPTPYAWVFGNDGVLTTPGSGTIRHQDNDLIVEVTGTDVIVLRTDGGDLVVTPGGGLQFNDGTIQTTALVQGEQVFTLDTGAIDYAPTVVDFNLLFVTPAIGYSGTDPTSVTLPAGVPGQRLVIFNGYNLATLTVNPGPVGRDISSGGIAEFIYSGFDGLWMPLYGTNSPT
jgi:hypothetical protein